MFFLITGIMQSHSYKLKEIFADFGYGDNMAKVIVLDLVGPVLF